MVKTNSALADAVYRLKGTLELISQQDTSQLVKSELSIRRKLGILAGIRYQINDVLEKVVEAMVLADEEEGK